MAFKIFKKIKNHWSALVGAVVLGVLCVSPFLYTAYSLGEKFQGIDREFVDDELFYVARMQDVIDGHPLLSNAYLAEHKDGPPQQLFLAEYLLAQPLRLLGMSAIEGHRLYNALLPPVIFLLTYVLAYLVSRSKLLAVSASGLLCLGIFLLYLTRPISPQFNFIFWLTQLILLWLVAAKHPRQRLWLILSALNLGLLFYVYPYYWTYYLILFGLLFLVLFLSQRRLAYRIFGVVAVGIALGSYYLYYTYQASLLPEYQETMLRFGMLETRFPSGDDVIVWSGFALVAMVVIWWKKMAPLDTRWFLLSLANLAAIIGVNQHLITKKNFEFSSHYLMLAIFASVLALVYCLQALMKARGHYKKYLQISASIIAIGVVGYYVRDYIGRVRADDPTILEQQALGSLFDWLNRTTAKDSVVYADLDLSSIIPAYTHNNIFYTRNANLFFISDAEIIERFALATYFEPLTKELIERRERALFGVRYVDAYGHAQQGNKLRKLIGLDPVPTDRLPEAVVTDVMAKITAIRQKDFLTQRKKYRVDYIVWPKNKPLPKQLISFKKIFETDALLVLSLVK